MAIDKPKRRYKNTFKSISNGQIVFEVSVLIIFIVLFVFPFLNLIAMSFSSGRAILSGEVYFWPVDFQVESWRMVLENEELIKSFVFTVALTFNYTVLGLLMNILASYPLSKKYLKGRKPIYVYILIPMYFSGGLIPTYLLYQSLNMLDTYWVLLIPGVFSIYNTLILRTFFTQIPDSLEESAKIDGANDFQILFRIYVPLSLPALATLALFYAVGKWNSFQDAVFFLPTRKDLVPLQLLLQRVLAVTKDSEKMRERLDGTTRRIQVLGESQKAANILFTVIPIILVYPWLQKYFVKGVTIGSIKE